MPVKKRKSSKKITAFWRSAKVIKIATLVVVVAGTAIVGSRILGYGHASSYPFVHVWASPYCDDMQYPSQSRWTKYQTAQNYCYGAIPVGGRYVMYQTDCFNNYGGLTYGGYYNTWWLRLKNWNQGWISAVFISSPYGGAIPGVPHVSWNSPFGHCSST